MKVSKQDGAASTELLLGILVSLPLFFGVSLLGKYSDMKHKNVEAARYVTWEHVVWGDSKTTSDLREEASERLAGHRSSTIVNPQEIQNSGVTEEVMWRDNGTRTLMVADGSTVRVNVATEVKSDIRHNNVSRAMANRMNLDTTMIRKYNVTMPITNYLNGNTLYNTKLRDFATQLNAAGVASSFNAKGAILTDSWLPSSESAYKNKVKRVTIESALDLAVLPGTITFGQFPLFKEGNYGANPDIVSKTNEILDKYVEDK
jgi:hypothetical protein